MDNKIDLDAIIENEAKKFTTGSLNTQKVSVQ